MGPQEVPGHLVAARVPADSDHHVREVLKLHHLAPEALFHHPSGGRNEKTIEFIDPKIN